MSRWTPCKRRDFILLLRRLGFDGPFAGTRHAFKIYRNHRLAIPSNADYSVAQLRVMIRELETILEREFDADEWTRLLRQRDKRYVVNVWTHSTGRPAAATRKRGA